MHNCYHNTFLNCFVRVCFFKVNSNIMDKSNDLKQLKEQIRKLDERLDADIQVKSDIPVFSFW